MDQSTLVQEFWERYLAALPDGQTRPETYQAWYFGDGPALADELAALVLAGQKTATAGLKWSYEAENESLPQPGGLSVITTYDGRPVAVIETTHCEILPFKEVGAEHAYLEGEDDRSLAAWREGHWRFFSRECAAMGRQPGEDMLVVCERFRLVYREDLSAEI